MISTISLKQKFFKKGYTGKFPNNYDDLLNLYTSLYGPPDLDNWSKDKLVVKIKELGYDKNIPSTLPELRKLFLQLYKPKTAPKKQPRESTIHDFTIAKLKENLYKMGYKGPNKKTKKEWYDLYVEYSKKDKPSEEDISQDNFASGNATVQQLKDELIKLGHKGGLSKKKKDELVKLYLGYKNGSDEKTEQKPNVSQMTIPMLKNELKKLGYTGPSKKKKQDWIDVYTKLLATTKTDEKLVPVPMVVESPVKQLNLDDTTINDIKHQVKKLGYTGPVQKNKQGWIDVYKKLVDTGCKQVGKFTYSITSLGMSKEQIQAKFQGKHVGIVYTVCKDKKCTFTINGAEKYKEFIFVMENSKGTYDGMEVNGHQVLTIDELPENLYDKLIGKCDIKDVSEEVMNFIEKIEKKTKSVCDNLLDNYKIIPIDKDGNCFFQAVGNALNIPMKKVREMMANKLTQKLVDVRNEFDHSNKTLGQYKDEILSDGTFVSDYDVEQLFPITFPGTGLIILNMNSESDSSGCDITCSSNLLENKNKYIVLLFQQDPSQNKDNGAHYDLISINSKPVLSHGDLSNKLIQRIHKQCKTIHFETDKIKPLDTTKNIKDIDQTKTNEIKPLKNVKDVEQTKTNEIKPLDVLKNIKDIEQLDKKNVEQKEIEQLDVLKNIKDIEQLDKKNVEQKEIEQLDKKNVEQKETEQLDKKNVEQKETEQLDKKNVEQKEIEQLDKKNVEQKETEQLDKNNIDKLELLKKEAIKQLLKEKGYTGILPKYKTELIGIYNKLYTEKGKTDEEHATKPLEKMTIQEIQTELQKKNITKYLPRTKTELIKLYNADRCDPVQEEWCSGDKICDLRNNVCMDKADIKPTKNTSIVFETMNDHPIAGTSTNLYQLKHAIKNKKKIEPISLTMPTSVEGGVIKVQSIDELKKTLIDIAQQNSFYKLISQLV